MELMIGLGLLGAAFVYGLLIYKGVRKSNVPAWASQAMVAVHSLVLTTVVFIAIGTIVQFGFSVFTA